MSHRLIVAEGGVDGAESVRRNIRHGIGVRAVKSHRIGIIDVVVARDDENLHAGGHQPGKLVGNREMTVQLAVLGQVARHQNNVRLLRHYRVKRRLGDGRAFRQKLAVLGEVSLKCRSVVDQQIGREVMNVRQRRDPQRSEALSGSAQNGAGREVASVINHRPDRAGIGVHTIGAERVVAVVRTKHELGVSTHIQRHCVHPVTVLILAHEGESAARRLGRGHAARIVAQR